MNHSIYSKNGKDNNNINPKDINLEKTKEKIDNNNCSIESDIYMTAKKDIYQPQNSKKEEKNEQNLENTKKEEEKKPENNYSKNFGIEGSLALMKTKEFNELLSDFDNKDTNINNDFKIINNNNEENKIKNEKISNLDNNESISSEDGKDDNKYFSDDDKSNNESNDDEEKVTEINENKNVDDNEDNEEEKTYLKNDIDEKMIKIDNLKKDIANLIGQRKI